MVCVSQSAVLPSLLAAPTLATRCALSWTTIAALRAATATGGVDKILQWTGSEQKNKVAVYSTVGVCTS